MSASMPCGPVSERSAESSTLVISPPPFEGLGSTLRAALSTVALCELYVYSTVAFIVLKRLVKNDTTHACAKGVVKSVSVSSPAITNENK